MVYSPRQVQFGKDKHEALPTYCRECEFLFACNGECPKHRFLHTPDGAPGLNYLCAGLKKLFRHIDPQMKEMARLVQSGRPAADIMVKESGVSGARARLKKGNAASRRPGRNDPCPCGSGKKYKKCGGK
jgi:uncharacterized protein